MNEQDDSVSDGGVTTAADAAANPGIIPSNMATNFMWHLTPELSRLA
jgi:hypothetical protein